MYTIGIDVGGSTTKIVGFTREGKLVEPIKVEATDPVTSVYGALGRFTTENKIALSEIDTLRVTGVGSSRLGDELYGCPCEKTDEFSSVGRGGLYLSGLEKAIVVSMGTGTAIVAAKRPGSFTYLGGTGVGGGTLMGLSRQMLGMDQMEHIVALAEKGNLDRVDLRVGDIAAKEGKLGLPEKMTASNFGKRDDLATREDLALGIMNMVFETVGMMAIFAARAQDMKDIVLTGALAGVPQAKEIFGVLSDMFGMHFIIPERSHFATVIGAALGGLPGGKELL